MSMSVDDIIDLFIIEELLDGGRRAKRRRLALLLQGANYDDVQDYFDGTGRWNRKRIPHDCRWWSKEAHKLPSALFRCLFRCRKSTFRVLVQALYGTTDLHQVNDAGPYIDPCEHTAVFLFRVGKGNGVMETAGHFNIAERSVVRWTLEVANRVVDRLKDQYGQWPGPEEQADMSTASEAEKALRLKQKFLSLQRDLDFERRDASMVIHACCVLYNFFSLHEGM